jgi:hypothetical protein
VHAPDCKRNQPHTRSVVEDPRLNTLRDEAPRLFVTNKHLYPRYISVVCVEVPECAFYEDTFNDEKYGDNYQQYTVSGQENCRKLLCTRNVNLCMGKYPFMQNCTHFYISMNKTSLDDHTLLYMKHPKKIVRYSTILSFYTITPHTTCRISQITTPHTICPVLQTMRHVTTIQWH